jgi:hypothetical protein
MRGYATCVTRLCCRRAWLTVLIADSARQSTCVISGLVWAWRVDAVGESKTCVSHLSQPLPSPDWCVDVCDSLKLACPLHDGVCTSVSKKPPAAGQVAVRVRADQPKPEIAVAADRLQRSFRQAASKG